MKKIISILLLSSIILVSCNKQEIEEKKNYKTDVVKSGYLQNKDTILANVEGENTSFLSFKNPGRIKDILIKEGENVIQGQILAILGNEEANISIQGSINIEQELQKMGYDIGNIGNDTLKIKDAINSLYNQRLIMLEQDYQKAQIGVQMAQKDLDLAKSTLEDTSKIFSGTLTNTDQKIQQAQNAYNLAKSNLENSKALLDQEKNNLEKNALNSLTNAYIIAKNAKDYLDNILGVTDANKYKNDSYEVYLGAKETTTKTNAETSLRDYITSYNETYKIYQDNVVGKNNINKESLIYVLNKSLETLNKLRDTLHDTKDMLDNSITSSNFNEDTLNGIKNQVTTIIANLEQAILYPTAIGMVGVKGSIQAIESFDKNYALKIKQLEDALAMAQEDLNMAKTGKNITSSDVSKNTNSLITNIKVKEDNLNITKISEIQAYKAIDLTKQEMKSKLAELDAKISESAAKKQEATAKIAEVSMNKNMAINSQESGIIRAPFNGIIIKKMSDIGSVIGAGMPIFQITSSDKKMVKTYINNEDYGLKNGDEIILLKQGSQESFSGKITHLEDIKDLISKKNYIEIEINSPKVQITDKVFVMFGSSAKKSTIIPSNAIITKYSQPSVITINGNKAQYKIIKIIAQDNKNSEIEGLKIGEKIITDGKDNILDGEELK